MIKKSKKSLKKIVAVKTQAISYRLKCNTTGNGLSHYVMYGDTKKALL